MKHRQILTILLPWLLDRARHDHEGELRLQHLHWIASRWNPKENWYYEMVKHSVWWEYCRHIDQLGHAWQAGTRDYLATRISLACSWWGLLASYCSCSTLCWATRNSPKVREIHQTSLHFPNLPPNTMFWICLGQHMSVRSGQKRDEDPGQHEHLDLQFRLRYCKMWKPKDAEIGPLPTSCEWWREGISA